jgi:phosphoglycolate phosphatase
MFKLILFDIDGTLIRTGGAGVKAFACAFKMEFGLADGSEKLKFAGRTDVSLVREFFSLHQIEPTPKHFERFFAVYVACLEKMILECKGEVCPGIADLMKELRALPTPPLFGLLTGNIRHGAQIKLQHFNLWNEFIFGGFADDHEERDCIAAIAKKRGADLLNQPLRDEEVLVIGDTPLDIRCARAINAKVLAVGTGGASLEELKSHRPDWVVRNLAEISVEKLCS